MTTLWTAWVLATLLTAGFSASVGHALKGSALGILIDERGRYSLARFHIVWWSAIVLPLVAAVCWARFTVQGTEVLAFTVPAKVLALLGVSVATTVTATGVKSHRDETRPDAVAGAALGDALWAQLVSVEEGDGADRTVDVGKVQSLVTTVLLGLAYVLTVIHEFGGRGTTVVRGPQDLTALPDLNATFVLLLAVSSAAYVGAKTIPRPGSPPNSLLRVRQQESVAAAAERASGLDMRPAAVQTRRRAARRKASQAARLDRAARAAAAAEGAVLSTRP